jgi:hypothetical protein
MNLSKTISILDTPSDLNSVSNKNWFLNEDINVVNLSVMFVNSLDGTMLKLEFTP